MKLRNSLKQNLFLTLTFRCEASSKVSGSEASFVSGNFLAKLPAIIEGIPINNIGKGVQILARTGKKAEDIPKIL